MTTYLLDVNLLLALSDPRHIHHEAAHLWFGREGQNDWATCPLTENGFVRIAGHPNYPNRPGDVRIVAAILQRMCRLAGHTFWADEVSILDVLEPSALVSHAHVTDIYLLGLAASKGGKLATFDQRIPVEAVEGGSEALELIRAEPRASLS